MNCLDSFLIAFGEDSGVWFPDVAVTTADSFYELPKNDLYLLRIKSDGSTESAPGGFIRFQCKMNLNVFPFDTMKCSATIESWFYDENAQVFDKEASGVYIYNWTEHEQWRLDGYSVDFPDIRKTSGDIHAGITFSLLLSRKAGYYLMNIIVPSLILSTLELVTFSLPPNQTIRIEVSFMCLLAYSMFQSMISDDLPKSADQTPLLSIYFTIMMFYIALAILMQCLVMTMTQEALFGNNVPRWATKFSNKEVQEYWEAHSHIADNDSIDLKHSHPEEQSEKKAANAKMWKSLFKLLDKIAAIVYLVLFVCSSIVILLIVPAAN